MGEYQRVACDGKVGFDSYKLANGVTARKNRKGRNAYRCKNCGKWHVGGMYLRKTRKQRRNSNE
jgi:hypothetical protein